MGADDLTGRRLILVEDETLVGLYVEELLEEWGCELVGWASSLAAAERLAQAAEADAALLDLNLEGVSSAGLAPTLKDRGIDVIVMTGYGSGAIPALPPGIPIIRKPVDWAELRATLLKVFAARSASSQEPIGSRSSGRWSPRPQRKSPAGEGGA